MMRVAEIAARADEHAAQWLREIAEVVLEAFTVRVFGPIDPEWVTGLRDG